jgi:VWFA-related protein
VVTDKAGKPVSGLVLQDFTLQDNNLPAKILSFHAIDATVQKAVRPTDIILLIDTVDQDFQTVARTREEIVKFLRQNGGHLAQRVSIFVFNLEGVKVLLQPSVDGNALATQLAQTDLGLREMGRSAGENGAIERFDLGVKWVGVIADRIGKAPGRKLLIWAGPGWPLLDVGNIRMSSKGQQQMFDKLVHLSTTLRESHMTVYSVAIGEPEPTTYLYKDYLKGVKTAERVNPSNLSLKVLATESGGQVMSPNNDVAGQIATCVQDAGAFYTLSFDPPKADKPNEYHDLKVEIDKPGLTARTSTGYYNQP